MLQTRASGICYKLAPVRAALTSGGTGLYSAISYLHALMRNTTKLKHILQLYTVTLDMNEDGQMHLMIFDKKDNSSEEFINKSYSVLIDKAFRYMIKRLPPRSMQLHE